MLVELSVMEQRYQAVLAIVQDGWKVTEVSEHLGVSRQAIHAWLVRYEQGGLAALADQSHRPHSCPHQIPAELEATICEMRRYHPGWGAQRIEHELGKQLEEPPSESAIYRCLRRHGLIELRARKKRREQFTRWQRERPMQLWQIDIMGGVLLEDGTELKIVTGVDDNSRFCVIAQLVRRAITREVCGAFAAALKRHGVPDEVLTDNGKQFTGRFGPHPGEVMFDRICRENGIAHRLTKPRSPTTTGKIERFHQSVRREFLLDRTFPSLKDAQKALDAWVHDYNTDRPHQALDMATPAQRFRAVPRERQATLKPVVETNEDQSGQWILRRVASNGVVSVDNQIASGLKAFAGQVIDVFVEDSVFQLWQRNHLIRTIARRRSGPVRKIRADGLHVKDQPTVKRKASAEG
jgi:transposase InsO family protein